MSGLNDGSFVMFRRLLAVTIALAIACAGSAADARSRAKARAPDNSDKWVLIATGDVDLARDTATIDATKAAGSYKALRLQARRQGIDLSRVAIVYGNGAVHNEDRRVSLRSGERSRAIDQRSEDRFVDTVTLTYKTDPKAKRTVVVDLYGLQGPEGRKAVRGSQPVAKGQPPQTGQITTSATNPEPIAVDPGSNNYSLI